MNWQAKENLRDVCDSFDAILLEASEVIRKYRGSLKTSEIDALYGVLGHIAANVSGFSEIVDRLEE